MGTLKQIEARDVMLILAGFLLACLRYRLPLAEERRALEEDWPHFGYPPQEAEGRAHARTHGQGQCGEIESALCRRACLRLAEGTDGLVRPHHRTCPRHGQNRPRKPRHQYAPRGLAEPETRPGVAEKRRGPPHTAKSKPRCSANVIPYEQLL